jgi:nitrogen PTS system EIIA component
MHLLRIINGDNLHLLKAKTKDKAITELFEIVAKKYKLKSPKTALKEILSREKLSPTAFGKGVAIPHYRSANLKDVIIHVGMSKNGIDFGAVDKIPVKLVFLILAGESKSREYLQLVAQLVDFVIRENLIVQALDFTSKELFLKHLESYENKEKKYKKTDALQNVLQIEARSIEIRTLEKEEKSQDGGADATIRQLINDLKQDYQKKIQTLDLTTRDRLQRLEGRYQGSITSKINNNACSFCMSVPSTADHSRLQNGEIIICTSCGKVLYLDE